MEAVVKAMVKVVVVDEAAVEEAGETAVVKQKL